MVSLKYRALTAIQKNIMKKVINTLALSVLLIPAFQFIGGNLEDSLKLHLQNNDPKMDRTENTKFQNSLLEDEVKMYLYIISRLGYTSLFLIFGVKAIFVLAEKDFV